MSATATTIKERELNSMSLLTAGVVLATVTMTFGAMIAVFLVRANDSKYWGHIELPGILWLTTAVLLASTVTLEFSRRALAANDQPRAFRAFSWTAGLGLAFLGGQLIAWWQVLHSGVVLARNPHSWFIFLFTALHGVHILLGLAGLGYLVARTREAVTGPKYLMKTRVVANGVSVFWHYLDFLWIVLFGLLLLWRR
ncbi:MAG TPA: cytochrome c oxidase subunit 3 [Bryobacteraceae bacterium]|jgi:cytochrome c oxidase subunit 3|nr:cytochrome c oxidase subunit 3 [Bryobacteraceae bacterium]